MEDSLLEPSAFVDLFRYWTASAALSKADKRPVIKLTCKPCTINTASTHLLVVDTRKGKQLAIQRAIFTLDDSCRIMTLHARRGNHKLKTRISVDSKEYKQVMNLYKQCIQMLVHYALDEDK